METMHPTNGSSMDQHHSPSGIITSHGVDQIRRQLQSIAAAILNQSVAAINITERFRDLGFDFNMSAGFVKEINESFKINLKNTDLFSYPDIVSLSAHIKNFLTNVPDMLVPENRDLSEAAAAPGPAIVNGNDDQDGTGIQQEVVAIIGMSGQFGAAGDIDAFWEALRTGKSLIEEVPDTRWASEQHYSEDKNEPDKTYSKWGSFIRDIDKFDPLFFKISGREAEAMDPQQRLFLEQCWKALEDAGINPQTLKATKCGVFAGVGASDYLDKTVAREASSFWGNYSSVLPARISYFLDLKGPAVAIDTACSSSLVALDMACKNLLSGETDLVLTGGVWIGTRPDFHKQSSRARMLSPNGTCYAFDSRANGFVPGEAVCVLVLKRLSDAERDGDHIHGIIRGSLTNQDGATNGITAPSAIAQQELEMEAYQKFRVHPDTIGYVEAHGTGTRLGDPIEFEALNASFRTFTDARNYCGLGSVKTNIGHAVMAAGIAGVTKVLLSLKHQQLVPSLNYQTANPLIDITDSPFRIVQELEHWTSQGDQPRRGTVSSFGFSGTNAHIILEEYIPVLKEKYSGAGAAIILLSAKSSDRLKEQVKNLLHHIDVHPEHDLYDMAYTLQTGREPMPERLAIVAETIQELREKLSTYENGSANGLYQGNSTEENMSFLLENEDSKTYIEEALKNKENHVLARFWVKGLHINWSLMYPGIKPAKIGLPTYPFARERYWACDPEVPDVPVAAMQNLHPLLHRNISTFSGQKFTSRLSGKESFLADHLVHEEKVLPGVAYLEMAREAGALSTRQPVTQLRNVSWISPIRVQQRPEEIYISLQQSGQDMIYEVVTQKNGTDQQHSKGTISTQPLPPVPPVDIIAIRSRFSLSKNKAACYQSFKAIGLNYGPGFRGLDILYYNEEEALSAIQLPADSNYLLNPGLLDSALQTCMGIMHATGTPALAVPFRVREVNIYGNLPEKVWSYVRRRGAPDSTLMSFDIDLLTESGEVILQFKDLAFLPLKALPIPAPATGHTALHLFNRVWKNEPSNQASPTSTHGPSLILLADGSERLADELKRILQKEVVAVSSQSEADFFSIIFQKIKKHIEERISIRITIVIENRDYENYGFIAGLLKTASLENPIISGRIIAVESLSIRKLEELTQVLINEQNNRETEVRYLNGARQVRTLRAMSTTHKNAGEVSIREGGVYLITGGTGGLGKIFAQHISKTRNTHIILTGRSAFNETIAASIRLIPNCTYLACDVCNKEEVSALIRQIRNEYKQINGIIHSAGVLRDGLILKGTNPEAVKAVLSPKVQGAINLDIATKDDVLDFMVFCSSIVSVIGNTGQGIYATANAYLDNYAASRNEAQKDGIRSGKTVSINWPFWQEGGMFMQEEQQRYLAREFGLTGMPVAAGLSALEQALKNDEAQVIVTYGQGDKIEASFTARQFITATAAGNSHKMAVVSTTTQEKIDITKQLNSKIKEFAAAILKFDAVAIKPDQELMGYGFDSNMLARFANDLNDFYGLNLVPTLFYNYATMNDLAAHLEEHYMEQLQQKHESETPTAGYHEQDTDQNFQPPATDLNERLVAGFPAFQHGHQEPVAAEQANIITDKTDLHSAAPLNTETTTASPIERERPGREPIAIVGISGRFPGSDSLSSFWEQIRDNEDLVTEIPADRWDWKAHYGDPRRDLHKTKAKWGGFITDIDQFDAAFFELSPLEAQLMDPQQRITLEAVYAALEDAAIPPAALKGTNTGVFIGVLNNDYNLLLSKQKDLLIQAQILTGNLRPILTNRISYLLDIHGPSEPVDTACSASLIAIHRAVENIRAGHCEIAIAGGVNAILAPETTIAISNAGMLSEDGRCKTFDQDANGYVRSEGVGIIILKSLSRAELDGDPIYGLIRGTAENHGGKANTLTSPNPQAQKDLLLSAYRSADIDPRLVTYIEAHGTGTSLGDPIETEALKMAFARLYKDRGLPASGKPHCGIGSVKANVGHLESAAGMAGVIKVLLSMKHKILPGNPQLITPNKYLQLSDSPFYLRRETGAWETNNSAPRIAGISGFGFGGANAHIVLEEYQAKPTEKYRSTSPTLILLSAKTTNQLRGRIRDLITYIDQHPGLDIYDIAYTLQTGRDHMKQRMATIVTSTSELLQRLNDYLNEQTLHTFTNSPNNASPPIEEEEANAFIEQAIKHNNLSILAHWWLQEFTINWLRLYPGTRPSRIALPTYPFARKRYWLPAGEQPTEHNNQLHPLLHANTSNLKAQKYTSLFTGKESFLKDHKVGGDLMLPGVAYLEMARQAGALSTLAPVTQLKNVSWVSPLRIKEIPVQTEISLRASGNEIRYEINSRDQHTDQLHCTGTMISGALQAPAAYSLTAIRDRFTASKSKAEYYALLQTMGLDYGASFQGIEILYYGQDEALSRIRLTKQSGYGWTPGILDSALQTCIGTLLQDGPPLTLVPFGVKEVNSYHDLPDEVWSYVRRCTNNTQGYSYDIDLIDDNGQVLLQFRELAVLPLTNETKSPLAKDESGPLPQTHVYDYDWVPTAAFPLADNQTDHELQVVVLGDNDPAFSTRLGTALSIDVITLSATTYNTCFIDLLKIIKAQPRRKTNILVLHRNDQYLQYGFLSGLLKTVNSEHPEIKARLLGLDQLNDQYLSQVINIVRTEHMLATLSPETEIRYTNGIRSARQLTKAQPASTATSSPGIKAGGVYLITGGAGGLGQIFCHHLMNTPGVKIILTGRQSSNERWSALGSPGSGIRYASCDISDLNAVQKLIADITALYGTLDGVIHSAGVIRDSLIPNKTEADIHAVFAPKIAGTNHLDEATKDLALDFMVFFSSTAAITGNVGQADYAAANTYLDNYASYRNGLVSKGIRQGATISINWPLWAEGGMHIDADSAAYVKRKWGMIPMPATEGIRVFDTLLKEQTSQRVVLYGDGQKIMSITSSAPLNIQESFAQSTLQNHDLKEQVTRNIIYRVATMLSYDEQDLMEDVALSNYGFNSYMLVRFANQINEYYDLDMAPNAFYQYPTINDLVNFLLENHKEQLLLKHPATGADVPEDIMAQRMPDTPILQTIQHNRPAGTSQENGLIAMSTANIRSLVANMLSYEITDLMEDVALGDYGFNSYMLVRFANQLNEYYDLDIAPNVFYHYPTINDLVAFLVVHHKEQLFKKHLASGIRPAPAGPDIEAANSTNSGSSTALNIPDKQVAVNPSDSEKPGLEPVAIVGMSGRFPGSADLDSFWEHLRDNKDMITNIPADRWDWREYDGDPRKDLSKTKAKWGGFIPDIDKFDPSFFDISPREAELMDPQQRITLEAVYNALEDAGIPPANLKGTNTGVFIGVLGNDYATLLSKVKDQILQAHAITGNTHSMLVNRISYLLDLHGPSEPVNTACSSSLIAINRAVDNIRSGRCDVAIAGGVNAILSPENTLSASNAGMLSSDGRCKAFDQEANGYVRAEGVGIVILKSLNKAEQDGDPIYGLIRGTAENHGGKANTLTAPNPLAQKELLISAYRSCGTDPRSVSYIEAHGTGTALGDPIETEGIKMAFAELYKDRALAPATEPYCGLGSVKANIGHLESAAGVAGIIKVLLSMKYRTLPGNPQLNKPNEYLRLSGTPFYLRHETSPWDTPNDLPRTAGVSSFGFGGTNAHIVLEEYQSPKKEKYNSRTPALLLLSAKNKDRLRDRVKNLLQYVEVHPDLSVYDIAYTLQLGRTAMEERWAIVANNLNELTAALKSYLSGKTAGSKGNSIEGRETMKLMKGILGHGMTEDLIKKQAYDQLLDLWCIGAQPDWQLLYPDQKPDKINLPAYPFSRERYWVTATEDIQPLPVSTGSLADIDRSIDWLQNQLITIAANTLKRPKTELSRDQDFFDYGVDSLSGTELIRNINAALQITLDFSVLFSNTNVTSLAAHIYDKHATTLNIQALQSAPIKVIADSMLITRIDPAAPENN